MSLFSCFNIHMKQLRVAIWQCDDITTWLMPALKRQSGSRETAEVLMIQHHSQWVSRHVLASSFDQEVEQELVTWTVVLYNSSHTDDLNSQLERYSGTIVNLRWPAGSCNLWIFRHLWPFWKSESGPHRHCERELHTNAFLAYVFFTLKGKGSWSNIEN